MAVGHDHHIEDDCSPSCPAHATNSSTYTDAPSEGVKPLQEAVDTLTRHGWVAMPAEKQREQLERMQIVLDMASIRIDLITSDYRGDHAADIRVAIGYDPDDGLAALLERLVTTNRLDPAKGDHLEVRLPIDTKGTES